MVANLSTISVPRHSFSSFQIFREVTRTGEDHDLFDRRVIDTRVFHILGDDPVLHCGLFRGSGIRAG